MKEAFERFINEYETAKGETFAQHPLGVLLGMKYRKRYIPLGL